MWKSDWNLFCSLFSPHFQLVSCCYVHLPTSVMEDRMQDGFGDAGTILSINTNAAA